MSDPLTRPSSWPKEYETYVEKHKVYEVFLETFRQLVLRRPDDPLSFIRDEIEGIAGTLCACKAFIVGEKEVAESIGREIADKTNANFINATGVDAENMEDELAIGLGSFSSDSTVSEQKRKGLLKELKSRILKEDCKTKGFVVAGFPRTQLEATQAQLDGIIPKLVVALLPKDAALDAAKGENLENKSDSVSEITRLYEPEVCQRIEHILWTKEPVSAIVEEILSIASLKKPLVPPWSPKIVVIGPPAAGKSTVANYLATRFQIARIDWMEAVRGAVQSKNEQVAGEARLHLKDLCPLSKCVCEAILRSRFHEEECLRRGWVIDGFPQNISQAALLEEMGLRPNRVVYLSCTEEVLQERIEIQRENVYYRTAPPQFLSLLCKSKDFLKVMGPDPYEKSYICKRFCEFCENVDELIEFYSADIFEVDASQSPGIVSDVVETFVLRPPIC